jgi:hypothetical protein
MNHRGPFGVRPLRSAPLMVDRQIAMAVLDVSDWNQAIAANSTTSPVLQPDSSRPRSARGPSAWRIPPRLQVSAEHAGFCQGDRVGASEVDPNKASPTATSASRSVGNTSLSVGPRMRAGKPLGRSGRDMAAIEHRISPIAPRTNAKCSSCCNGRSLLDERVPPLTPVGCRQRDQPIQTSFPDSDRNASNPLAFSGDVADFGRQRSVRGLLLTFVSPISPCGAAREEE